MATTFGTKSFPIGILGNSPAVGRPKTTHVAHLLNPKLLLTIISASLERSIADLQTSIRRLGSGE